MRLEQADELALHMSIALEEALTGLMHDLLHERYHPLQIDTISLQAHCSSRPLARLSRRPLPGRISGLDRRRARCSATASRSHCAVAPGPVGRDCATRGNLDHPMAHTAGPITQSGADGTGDLCDAPHGAGQHPNPVAEQGTVGRIVDVGLDNRGVHP